MLLYKNKRPDWFDWLDPDPDWIRAHVEVPGLQYAGDGQRVTCVTLHRTHLSLLHSDEICARWPMLYSEVVDFLAITHHAWHYTADVERRLLDNRGVELRSYQSSVMLFMRDRAAALLALEQRLGKTAAACAVHDPRDGALVVAGPLASRDVWRDWIMRVHDTPALVLQGRQNVEFTPGYPAYFVHYDVLEAQLKAFTGMKIATLVLDECHLLQSGRSRRSIAAGVLALQAQRVLALSGTPMWSRPESLYALLHILTPGAWHTRHNFCLRYCNATPGAYGWSYSGSSNEDELRLRLSELMIRRTWKDVAPDLPPVVRAVEPCPLTDTERVRIDAAVSLAQLRKGTPQTVAGHLATLRRALAAGKVKPAVEAAIRAMLDDHKVVVWVWHNEVGGQIEKALRAQCFPTFRVKSEDNADLRAEQIERFRDMPQAAVMIASIACAGVAIDLSCADVAIFAELDWTPLMINQAEMRTFSPERPHSVLYLYADTDVEQHLIDTLGVKEDLASRVGLRFDEVAKVVLGG